MDKWTCYPCHLNTCSLRLICKPKWFSSLTNISKKFFFPFWKIWPPSLPGFKLKFGKRLHMKEPRVPCLNHQGPPPLLSKIFWGTFLKSLSLCTHLCHLHQRHLRLRHCSGLIYLMVIITKMSRPLWYFDMLFSTTRLDEQEVAVHVCDNLLSPKSTIIINVLNVGKTWGAPFDAK